MPFFSKVFKSRDASSKSRKPAVESNGLPAEAPKPKWEHSWERTEVQPEEIRELIHLCTQEMKSRGTYPDFCNVFPSSPLCMIPLLTWFLVQLSTPLSFFSPSAQASTRVVPNFS